MKLLILSIVLVALFFVLMSVRLLLIKGGEFRGTCASQSPWLNKEGITCAQCGKTLSSTDSSCGDPDTHNQHLPEVKKRKS